MVGPPAQVSAEVYQWTDREGVVHYTSDAVAVPDEFRASSRVIDSPQPLEQTPTSPPAATVISFAAGRPMLVGARVNGVSVTLMLDTGADRTVIAEAALGRAGIVPTNGRSVRIVGVAGSATASEAVVPVLEIAGARLGPVLVVAHDPAIEGAEGLIGRDVLDAFTLTIDPAAGRATLVPR